MSDSWVSVGHVSMELMDDHALRHIVGELLDLFANVTEKGVA